MISLLIAVSASVIALGSVVYPWLAIIRSPVGNIEAGVFAHILAAKMGLGIVMLGAFLPIVVSLPRLRCQHSGLLATNGAYSLSRHPMYITNALVMFPGFGVMLNNWMLALLLAGAGFAFYLPYIRFEEEFLEKKHGATYLEYQKRVGLLLSWGRR